ncbi:MAG: flagellar basal body L-ring protein FlgH [Firmicutes bacterium]|nr:flagellar basal body L-ring protein FlgH [Bacillota bacterium]
MRKSLKFRRPSGRPGVAVLVLVACSILGMGTLPAARAAAESLWKDGTPSLFVDHKARNVGDLVTVLIMEHAVASNKAQTSSGNKVGAGLDQGTGLLEFIPEAGLGAQSRFAGSKSTSRSGSLVAKMSARVVEVLPDGNLKIQGSQALVINNEKQNIVVTGIVRPEDIGADNTVMSTYVADAEIRYEGKLEVAERQGILGYLSRFFSGLVGLIF